MNINELKNILGECELDGEKIVIKSDLLKTLEFIKNNYSIDICNII